jgi:hypothetical protein
LKPNGAGPPNIKLMFPLEERGDETYISSGGGYIKIYLENFLIIN